jgi:hypothetical protein
MKLFLFFTSVIFSTHSFAQNVTVLNTFSCGSYVESRVRRDVVPSIWVLGFLSGANVFNQRKIDILQTIDRESILLWMDKRCKDNPLEYVEDGAALLMQELAQKALERNKK